MKRKQKYSEQKRVLFLRWLCKLAKVPECTIPPKWVLVFQWVLFPVRMIGLKYSPIKWDPPTNIYTIDDLRISGYVLWSLGKYVEEGSIFKLVKREIGGIVTLENLSSPKGFELTSKEFIKEMYKRMVTSQEKSSDSSSFGDTLYVTWGVDEHRSTKEIMEYLIQNDR